MLQGIFVCILQFLFVNLHDHSHHQYTKCGLIRKFPRFLTSPKSLRIFPIFFVFSPKTPPINDIIILRSKKEVNNLEWIDDSKACLSVAQVMLEEVDKLIQESIQHKESVPFLKVKIKNCLENCRSPLDYAANYIFDTYCRKNYSQKELGKFGKPYFPIINKVQGKDEFDKCIKVKFKGLKDSNENIVDILENYQEFNYGPWLQDLTSLINENKHRHLTKQQRRQTTHIKYGRIGNGIASNIMFAGSNTPLSINGSNVDFLTPSPYDKYFVGNTQVEFFFEDLKKPVIPVLKEIHSGVNLVINDLEQIV